MSQALKIKKLEKQVNKSIADDLKLYEAKVFETRYFSHIQKYLSCIRKNPAIPTQVYNKERTAVSELDCAEMFNNFFASVFNTRDTTHDADFNRNVLNWFRFDQPNLNELLQEINIRKSTGPDGIGNIMLKKATDGISKPLTFVYQTIVKKGCFPTQWTLCHVCPVFKDGNKKDVSCYRPISLISCLSKVFEKKMFDHIYSNVHSSLHAQQFGFRKKRSAKLQLLVLLDRIHKYNDDKELENLSVLYLDFSKAFDTVPHNLVVRKVRRFGIGGKLLKLINSYLSGRFQSGKLNNTVSSPLRVTSGVPQGSILGPLLFLVYLNVLPDSFQECFGYADDYKILFRNQEEVDEGRKKLESWCTLNNMKLKAKKM